LDSLNNYYLSCTDSLIKLDTNGLKIWSKNIGYIDRLIYNNEGNILMKSKDGLTEINSATGDIIWSNSNFIGNDLVLDKNDNCYIISESYGLQKIDNNGESIWTEPPLDSHTPQCLAISNNENIYVINNDYTRTTEGKEGKKVDITTIKYSQCPSNISLLRMTNNSSNNNQTTKTNALHFLNIYPNPNNGNMQVDYELPDKVNGIITFYEMTGREAMKFDLYSGKHSFAINGSSLERGIYFYHAIGINGQSESDKIVVIK
jgi:hypothetical protein